MNIVIKAYKLGSAGAKELKKALVNLGHRVLIQRRHLAPRLDKYNINWGCSVLSFSDVINQAGAVSYACNKASTFDILATEGISCVQHTTQSEVAYDWLSAGETVIARTLLNSHSGRGIVVVSPGEQVPAALLYTKYFKKKHEYRVHVMFGEVVLVQQKLKRRGAEHDSKIRTHSNGYVFAVNDIIPPDPSVLEISTKAVQALGLDFGAVDIGWNEYKKEAKVFEVNTAPGLTPSTASIYATCLSNFLKMPGDNA